MGDYFCINSVVKREDLSRNLILFFHEIGDKTTLFNVSGYSLSSDYSNLEYAEIYDPNVDEFSAINISVEELIELISENIFSEITIQSNSWFTDVRLILGVYEDNSIYLSIIFEDEPFRESLKENRKKFILELCTLLYNSIPNKYGNGGLESQTLDDSSLEWPQEYFTDALYFLPNGVSLNFNKSKYKVIELNRGLLFIDESQI